MAGSAVIVLLAAGEGRRFGSIKQLADIDGEPMVRRSARNAIDSGAPVVVVTGADAEMVEDALTGLAVQVIRHAAWAEGIGSSLAAGIRELNRHFPHTTGALLCLADQPMIEQALSSEGFWKPSSMMMMVAPSATASAAPAGLSPESTVRPFCARRSASSPTCSAEASGETTKGPFSRPP